MNQGHLRLLLGVLSAASLLLATGCDETRACTAIGCAASRLELATDGWTPGEYEIELRYTLGGEQAFVCTLSVGEQGGDDAGPIQSTCRQTVGEGRAVHLYPTSDSEPTLEVYDSPDEVQLILRSGSQTLFDDTITLEHVESYPNGPDCGSCRSASMRLSLL